MISGRLPSRSAARTSVRAGLSRALGSPRRARAAYDLVSALRNLAGYSWQRRIRPAYWRARTEDRRAGRTSIAIHGEFGDAVLALPYLYALTQRPGATRVRVLVRGEVAGTATASPRDPFSERGVRVMTAADGGRVNFLAEFWRRVPFVDSLTEGDIRDPAYRYWQPQPALLLRRQTRSPRQYAPFLDDLFTDEDRSVAAQLWASTGRPVRVVVHLRRSADQLAALVAQLDASPFAHDTAMAVLGSRRHQSVPDLATSHLALLDLTDNYERGVSFMPLLQVIRDARLFMGGRGGIEAFALAAGVPTLTVFDDDGWWEERRLWPEALWRDNPLGVRAYQRGFNAEALYAQHLAPWLGRMSGLAGRP